MFSQFVYSSKRREEYRQFQVFAGVDMEEVLKHVSTRWLSMEKCINRTLSQWSALYSYYNTIPESEKRGKAMNLAKAYASDETKLYFHFLSYALTRLNKFNVLFQVRNYTELLCYNIFLRVMIAGFSSWRGRLKTS